MNSLNVLSQFRNTFFKIPVYVIAVVRFNSDPLTEVVSVSRCFFRDNIVKFSFSWTIVVPTNSFTEVVSESVSDWLPGPQQRHRI